MLKNLPLKKIFRRALRNGGDLADLFFESTQEIRITADNNRIEKVLSGCDTGLGIRIIKDMKSIYAYTNDLSGDAVIDLADTIAHAARSDNTPKTINPCQKRPSAKHMAVFGLNRAPLDEKVAVVHEADRIAWGFDKRIQQVSVIYKDTNRKISVANSSGDLIEDETINTSFLVTAIASDGNVIQTGSERRGAMAGFEFFDDHQPAEIAGTACRRAILMLSARPAPAGTMPVILSAEAGGTMIHEAVGHGLEADLALEGFSIYQNKIGEKVASEIITVIDDATIPGMFGTFSFDDEGSPAQKTILIEKGVLKNYMHNIMTAAKSGTKSTGNGRRESYRYRPEVRMTNTLIQAGRDDPDSIIRDTSRGLFVKKMGGGQVNTMRGDFVFDVQEGYLIENGEITKPVRGATLTGNGPEVLKIIDRVGSDLGSSIGLCGKSHQSVPIGDAQPTIRIPELVIGGTSS